MAFQGRSFLLSRWQLLNPILDRNHRKLRVYKKMGKVIIKHVLRAIDCGLMHMHSFLITPIKSGSWMERLNFLFPSTGSNESMDYGSTKLTIYPPGSDSSSLETVELYMHMNLPH